jgi:hypothetical protein
MRGKVRHSSTPSSGAPPDRNELATDFRPIPRHLRHCDMAAGQNRGSSTKFSNTVPAAHATFGLAQMLINGPLLYARQAAKCLRNAQTLISFSSHCILRGTVEYRFSVTTREQVGRTIRCVLMEGDRDEHEFGPGIRKDLSISTRGACRPRRPSLRRGRNDQADRSGPSAVYL